MATKPRRMLPLASRRRRAATIVMSGLIVSTMGAGAVAATGVAGHRHAAHRHQAAPIAAQAEAPLVTTSTTASGADLAPPTRRMTAKATTSTANGAPVPSVTAGHRPKHLVDATLLVTTRKPLSHAQRRSLTKLAGVKRTEQVSAGWAKIDTHRAFVLGVDPASFRPWTPKLTAKSNALWQSIARGDLTASFDMGHDASLPLGQPVPVKSGKRSESMRIGAFASVGMSDVDGVVAAPQAHSLGLVHNTGLVLSAPKADPLVLRKAALSIAGKHAHAQLLREVIVTRDAGEFLTRQQISTFLHAAASRVGYPYVWGAEGPHSFDCSGLVQWSFAKAGIRMPRVAAQQWFTGPHIAFKDARPGDLLFWHYDPTDPTNIDHTAIYAGNGMMLVAPHTGTNVSYKPVPLADMAGVVRVDPALAAQIS